MHFNRTASETDPYESIAAADSPDLCMCCTRHIAQFPLTLELVRDPVNNVYIMTTYCEIFSNKTLVPNP